MLEVSSSTPFAVACVPDVDLAQRDRLVVVVKGTFRIRPGDAATPLAEEPEPLVRADEFHGEPGASSVRREAETGPPRPGADVLLLGHAWARSGARASEVELEVGALRKTVRVVGDRRWQKTLLGWRCSDPEPFERMPLTWEHAFGGSDGDEWERRNPVGKGFVARRGRKASEGDLPNLEDPRAPIRSHRDRPTPSAFAFVGRGWEPRLALAGTYDEAWSAERCPLLPLDFDERHHQAAPPGLVAERPFQGGEPVRVRGAHRDGDLAFALPRRRLGVTALVKGEPRRATPVLDTVRIEPDEERLVLLWRTAIPCSRELLLVSHVFVREEPA